MSTDDKKKSFSEDPLVFCQQIYDEGKKRQEALAPGHLENRLLYEGEDETLKKRAANTEVRRSAIFFPVLKPSIDTRVAGVVTRLDQHNHPVRVIPASLDPTDEEKDQALWMETQLDAQLRKCGYLSDGFHDHILGAEMYRVSVVKVGWEYRKEWKPVVKTPTMNDVKEWVFSVITMKPKAFPRTRVKWEQVEVSAPYAEWLSPEELLYPPDCADWRYAPWLIHSVWKTPDELRAMGKDLGYDEKSVAEAIKTAKEVEGDGNDTFPQREAVERAKDTALDKGIRDGKILVNENYVEDYGEDGEPQVWCCVTLANKWIAKKERGPYRGIRFAFVQLVANRLPGTAEGMPTCDIAKAYQKLYNEAANIYIDAVSYDTFKILLVKTGTTFGKKLVVAPGALWYCSDPTQIVPLNPNPTELIDVQKLMQFAAETLREVINASDLTQGIQDNPYEKATSSKIRIMSSEKKSIPMQKRCGEALIEVARMFIALNQQKAENGDRWVMDYILDVPSLTSVTDPEEEKQNSLLLVSQLAQNPVMQNPMGLRKLRNATEDMIRKFNPKMNIDDIFITEEELEMVIGDQAKAQALAIEKQAAQEQLAIVGQQAQMNEKPQEAKSAD